MDNKECIKCVTLNTQNPRYKFSTGACFCVSLAQNMNDKRLGCLKIVHAHTGLQSRHRCISENYTFRKCWVGYTKCGVIWAELTRNLWFSASKGENVAQNLSISALMSPEPLMISMNFFLSGASFMAT